MRYQEYEKKVARLVKIRNVIYRFRVALISAAIAILAVVVTSNVTKGIIISDISSPKTIEYGTTLNLSSSAFLGRTTVEYKQDGTNTWTKEVPVLVGDYSARTYSKNSFGHYYYGNEIRFKIVPKAVDVTISENSQVYGEEFHLDIDLAYEDKIAEYKVDLESILDTRTKANPKNVKIVNKDSVDVTKCYSFSYISKRVEMLPRKITVASPYQSKEYDGEPINLEGPDIINGSLAKGDNIFYESIQPTFIFGTGQAYFTAKVLNKFGNDVSHFYDIHYEYGHLQINRRKITITSYSYNKTYDGTGFEINGPGYAITSGSLVPGHRIQYLSTLEDRIRDPYVKDETNYFTVSIINESNENVTQYYDIEPVYGKITITKRKITIKTGSMTNEYDGTLQSCTSYVFVNSSLADGDRVISFSATVARYVAIYTNEFLSMVIENSQDVDVTFCYEISYVFGQINIERREVHIQTSTTVKQYNGSYQTPDTDTLFTITYGSLADGDFISYQKETLPISLRPCSLENRFNFRIYNSQTKRDVTDQYHLTISYGTFQIVKRETVISNDPIKKIYDNEPYDAVVYGDYTKENIKITPEIPTSDMIQGIRIYHPAVDAGEYTPIIDISDISVTNVSEGDVRDCYYFIVRPEESSLCIAQRIVNITGSSEEFIYDAQYHTLSGFTVTGLLDNHTISGIYSEASFLKDAGSVPVNVLTDDVRITDSNGNDVTHNYAINVIPGTLTIKPRPITFTCNPASKVFDNRPLEYDHTVWISSGNFVPGDRGNFSWISDKMLYVTDVPQARFDVYNSNDEDVTSNYDVTYDFDVKIEPLILKFEVDHIYTIYDGEYQRLVCQTGLQYVFTSNQTYDDSDKFKLVSEIPNHMTVYASPRNIEALYVGTYTLEDSLLHYSVYDTELNDYIPIENFGYETIGGLTIKEREITVASINLDIAYIGTETPNELFILEGSLGAGDSLYYDGYMMSLKDRTDGYVINDFDLRYVHILRDGKDVTENYRIRQSLGTVRIY